MFFFPVGMGIRCQNSTMREEKSREALVKVAFNVKSGYPKTSTDSLIQRHSQDIKISVPEIKESSSLSDNPRHELSSGPGLSQNFSDVCLL